MNFNVNKFFVVSKLRVHCIKIYKIVKDGVSMQHKVRVFLKAFENNVSRCNIFLRVKK